MEFFYTEQQGCEISSFQLFSISKEKFTVKISAFLFSVNILHFSQILGCFSSFFVYNLSHLLEQVQESKNWELSLFLTLCKCYISDSHFVSHIWRWVTVPTDCLATNNANYCCYALTKIRGWYIKFKKKKKKKSITLSKKLLTKPEKGISREIQ